MREWPTTEAEAIAEQDRLRPLVTKTGVTLPEVHIVAGLDVAYDKTSDNLVAAAAILDVHTLKVLEEHTTEGVANFPYISGLFAFRELPTLLEVLSEVTITPDIVVCDGYGLAHPRRFGLASHLGVTTGLPCIGVAKTAFIGEYQEPAVERGAWTNLIDGGEIVGRVLRTQRDVKPVFVSIGHKVDLDTATQLVLALTPRYRLPETTRAADHLAKTNLGQTSQ